MALLTGQGAIAQEEVTKIRLVCKAHLEAARISASSGNIESATGALVAVRSLVWAQSGKQIDPAAATILAESTTSLIDGLL